MRKATRFIILPPARHFKTDRGNLLGHDFSSRGFSFLETAVAHF